MNIFQKSAAGLNLTPGQRATLKLVQSFGNAGITAVLLALPMWLSAQDGKPLLTWTGAGIIAGVFVHGFMTAWQKYVSAKGDLPLAGAIGAVDATLGARLGTPPATTTASVTLSASQALANATYTAPDANAPIVTPDDAVA